MKLIKLILLNVFLVSGIHADSTYICSKSLVSVSAIVEGKKMPIMEEDLIINEERKYFVKKEWYGSPIYAKGPLIRGDRDMMLKNTQSKSEWIQSDSMDFSIDAAENGMKMKFKLSIEKGSSPLITIDIKFTPTAEGKRKNPKLKNGSFRTVMQCYEQ